MAQLKHIEAIEKRLWNAADTLRVKARLCLEYAEPTPIAQDYIEFGISKGSERIKKR